MKTWFWSHIELQCQDSNTNKTRHRHRHPIDIQIKHDIEIPRPKNFKIEILGQKATKFRMEDKSSNKIEIPRHFTRGRKTRTSRNRDHKAVSSRNQDFFEDTKSSHWEAENIKSWYKEPRTNSHGIKFLQKYDPCTLNISDNLLRPSQFLEKFMKIVEWSTLQK